jgi:hypothetical protein
VQRPRKPFQTDCFPLELMPFKESTNEGTQQILENVMEVQFGLKESNEQFKNKFRLVFGDCLTTLRLHAFKAERSIHLDPYQRLDWLLPVFGLWHLKYNYAQLLHEHHFVGPNGEHDSSAMYETFSNWYDSKSLNPKHYRKVEALIVQTWQSNMAAVLMQIWVDEHEGKIPEKPDLQNWIEGFSQNGLTKLIKRIMKWFNKDCMEKPDDERDEEWCNHVNFIRNTLPFLTLQAAVKRADIGVLRHAIDECCLLFSGTKRNWLYTRELLYYKWLTDSPASDKRLQRAVLYNSLVNPHGSSNTYYEEDNSVEELNLVVKTLMRNKRTSSQDLVTLLQRYTHNIKFFQRQRKAFSKVFFPAPKGYKASKVADSQIFIYALILVKDGKVKEIPRTSIFQTRDLMKDGIDKLPDKVGQFNDFLTNTGIREMHALQEELDGQRGRHNESQDGITADEIREIVEADAANSDSDSGHSSDLEVEFEDLEREDYLQEYDSDILDIDAQETFSESGNNTDFNP